MYSPVAVTLVPALGAGSVQSVFNFQNKVNVLCGLMVFGLQVFKPQPCLGANLTEQLWISQLEKVDVPRGQFRNEEKDFIVCQYLSDVNCAEQGEIALTWIVQKTLNQ